MDDSTGLVSVAVRRAGRPRTLQDAKKNKKKSEKVQKVSSTALHKDTRRALDLLRTTEAVAVTHYNEVEGYLVSPDRYHGLVERATHAEERMAELSSTLPLLLAAARTGVPIPSDTLEGVLPTFNLAEHWREVAEFAATFPVIMNAGEYGEPITRAHFSPGYGDIEDSGTDDDLNLG